MAAEDTKPSFLGLLNGIALAEEGAGVFLSAWAVRSSARHCSCSVFCLPAVLFAELCVDPEDRPVLSAARAVLPLLP